MTFDQVYAQSKLVVETAEIEKKQLESQENLCAYEICRISDLEKDIEFYSKIAEACEKQIAKKPNARFYPDGSVESICPICDEALSEDEFKYCQDCGKKLDWGKE